MYQDAGVKKEITVSEEELIPVLLQKRRNFEMVEVIDTILTDKPPIDCDEAVYFLGSSIQLISKADAIVFMKGWEKARGCRIEHTIAYEYGKFIKEEQ